MPDERLWSEMGAAAEYLALVGDPVFYGVGVPRGHGESVLVIPGLFGNDAYLTPLRTWLRRIGYRPVASSIAFNAGCSDRIFRDLEANLSRSPAASGEITIIGHSRGGILGWALAAKLQERVTTLALVGSPAPAVARGLREGSGGAIPPGTSQAVVDAGLRVRQFLDPDCDFPTCGCDFVQTMSRPLNAATRLTAIVSEDDPVVPSTAGSLDAPSTRHVRGTHGGLVVNREVYRILGDVLGAPRP